MPMHCKTAPFDDNNVRLAMKWAINRRQLLDTTLRGFGELGNDHPIGPANVYRATAAELPKRHYDADMAKYYLKLAGCS